MLVTELAIRFSLMPDERFVRPIHLLNAALSISRGRRSCSQTLQRLQTFRIASLPTLYEIALNSYHSVAGSYVAETGFPHLLLRTPLPTIKVGDSLGAVGSCGSIRTPSPIPRSAPDPAHIPPHFGAKPKPEIEKRALRSPKPETEMVAPPEIGAKSDRKWNRWRPDHVISCSFGRQTTGNGNDGAPIALWTGYRIEGPTWHQLLWSIKD